MSTQLKTKIKTFANQLGFPMVGVTHPQDIPSFPLYQKWIENEHHANMNYLSNERALHCRQNPVNLFAATKSIFVVGMPFDNPANATQGNHPTLGKISTYANHLDYHDIIKKRLKKICRFVEEQIESELDARVYVDTGPIIEKQIGQLAGLGWIGKNSMLINPVYGSAFFIGVILWNIDLPKDEPFEKEYCGQCNRCMAACPTQAILTNRTLDARRCLSYLTIEHREEIPEQFYEAVENRIFGCDECIRVCPWNVKRKEIEIDPAYHLRSTYQGINLAQELTINEEQFREKFRKSPIKRTKWRGYLRNVIIAAGNSKDPTCLPALEVLQRSEDKIHEKHAIWSIQQLKNKYFD